MMSILRIAQLRKRLLGLRWRENGAASFHWGDLNWRGWGLGLFVSHHEDHWTLGIYPGFGSIYIRLWNAPEPRCQDGDWVKYGFSWHWGSEWGNGDSIHLNWGCKTKILHMPWGWVHQRHSILLEDGRSWVHELKGYNVRHGEVPVELPMNNKWFFFSRDLPRWKRELPYSYVLRIGALQSVTATVGVSEREWRMRALQWLPWPRLVRRTIDVDFSGEVGEGAGSWKGGTVGCSLELLPGEMAEECLRRMERERKFGR